MLEFFRSSLKSKLGAAVALGFLILIALAFASADVTGSGNFGGIAGGDRVATVGKQRISTSELRQAATNAVENAKQEDPRYSMQAFLAQGGLDRVLDDMIARTALSVFGSKHGIVAGDRLVDSEIAKIPAFQGPDGKFSDAAYRQLLQQRGLTDKQVREDLAQGLVAKMLLVPAGYGASMPAAVARQYAALLGEKRTGAIALLPAEAFQPTTAPTPAELQAFYTAHKDRYVRPERRVLRYAMFGESNLGARATPTEAEVAARYAADKARYEAVELRKVTQLVLPSEDVARAVAGEVAKGTSLDAAAKAKGLATSTLGPLTRSDLAGQASKAVADAAFSATRGSLSAPVRGALGWTIVRVDAVENRPARSLDQVRGEITAALTEQKRRTALADLSSRIEEEFDNGGNLAEAAKELAVEVKSTPAITADGRVYGTPGQQVAPELAKVVQAAFSMEREGQPQIAELVPGKTYVMFDVTDITASAAAPLAEIRDDVVAGWKLDKGSAAAKAAASQLLAQAKKGTTLSAALASLKRPLPAVQQISMNRQQLTANGQQVPPPLMLLFSMARGTTKLLPAPGNQGWFVVSLASIETPPIKDGDPIIAAAQRQLGGLLSSEYADQLGRAIRAEVGATRNASAIRSVRDQLGGNAN